MRLINAGGVEQNRGAQAPGPGHRTTRTARLRPNGWHGCGCGFRVNYVFNMGHDGPPWFQNMVVTVKWRCEPDELLIYSGPTFLLCCFLFPFLNGHYSTTAFRLLSHGRVLTQIIQTLEEVLPASQDAHFIVSK